MLRSEGQRNNLPAQVDSFIGRQHQVAELRSMLLGSTVRLLTVVGPPGVGKTRLSLQLARLLVEEFPGGVCFVPLAAIHDPGLVIPAIARVVGVRESPGWPVAERLIEQLGAGRRLLVLDNCEQVLAAAPVVSNLLVACPGLKVLATSREPLRIAGEQEYPLSPLELPGPSQARDVATLARVPAVALFVQRARAVKPDFALTEANATETAAICARLDGLPLAIELAAARSKVLSPRALLFRLNEAGGSAPLRLLSAGLRGAPARQQTLQGAIAWSYDLLEPAQQQLFRRLSVFVGGWTVEAAATVCGTEEPKRSEAGAIPAEAGDPLLDALDALASLVDKSLLRQEPGADAEPRFRMLALIREYALERLEAATELPAIAQRHATVFLELAERCELEIQGPRHEQAVRRLEAEHDNLRAAMRWLRDQHGGGERLARLAGALWFFWSVRGHLSEGQAWLEAALARSGVSDLARAKALLGLGWLAWRQGGLARAAEAWEQSLAASRQSGDPQGIARALYSVGFAAAHGGDIARAEALLGEALGRTRELGQSWDVEFALHNLGRLACARGDLDRAVAYAEEGLGLARARGYIAGQAWFLDIRSGVAQERGAFDRAGTDLAEALTLFRRLEDGWGSAYTLQKLARLARVRGDADGAVVLATEALPLCRALGDRWIAAQCFEDLARVAGARGQAERAALLFGAAAAQREAAGMPLPPAEQVEYERSVAATRAQLGEVAFGSASAEGHGLPFDRALARALEPDTSVAGSRGPRGRRADRPGLTERQREVAVLVRRGLTNRRIAAELIISELTVETHVRDILRQLGFASRAQIAAWVAGQGQAERPEPR